MNTRFVVTFRSKDRFKNELEKKINMSQHCNQQVRYRYRNKELQKEMSKAHKVIGLPIHSLNMDIQSSSGSKKISFCEYE